MKIQCDVCEKEEASVFCFADEAALCDGCDRRVHHANKLASKHDRFYLLHPSFKESPHCDICQERRGFLFCKEDRAILCRECDIPIHKANEHTQTHNRFLLTGLKLSAAASLCQASSSSNKGSISPTENETEVKSSVMDEIYKSNVSDKTLPMTSTLVSSQVDQDQYSKSEEGTSITISNISEYLMKTLPGWHVEDFLDPTICSLFGFCKTYNHMSSSANQDLGSISGTLSSENVAIWSQQAQPEYYYITQTGASNGTFFKGFEEVNNVIMGVGRKRNEDVIALPQAQTSASLKRSRQFW